MNPGPAAADERDGVPTMSGPEKSPLASDSGAEFDRLIEAAGPPSLMVVIASRMGERLKQHVTPEDIWQETVLHAWRDRKQFQWRGRKEFRSWLLTIIDHRIRDAAAYHSAAKRGGLCRPVVLAAIGTGHSGDTTDVALAEPIETTTPSRIAIYKEQAAAIQAALDSLPQELRDVVRLRLLEQVSLKETAQRLGITEAVASHRSRKGAELYRRRLMAEFASRGATRGS